MSRFERPSPGHPTPIHFPAITRTRLDNGLGVWGIAHRRAPIVTATLLLARGSGDDPIGRHGLASLTGDLLDEGAGTRDAIALADAFGRLGTQLDIDVGPDATSLTVSGLARVLPQALALMADVVMRPRIEAADFARVRELRLSRLRQLSRSAATMADRAYVSALFGAHAYGHGALGTSASLDAISIDDARAFWSAMYGPVASTLIVVGDVDVAEIGAHVDTTFGGWREGTAAPPRAVTPDATPDRRVLLVDRPGAPQAELRIGHVGPSRLTPAYHALVTLNAVLGGQFTSRINRRLREEKGVTYGARTSFDFRRVAGTFSCDTSVQADATGTAVADVLDELDRVRQDEVPAVELDAAKASLTRGYVRNFETAGQLARAAVQLAAYGLADDTFDRFVPGVDVVSRAAVHAAASEFIRPADATIVVVGDAETCQAQLETLGRTVELARPEF
ncbi:MAG TPA: pitrilysin family protein [Vicinamibacterales bacterium]|jgi:predicted Zn-dependent peptidase|nr:pitrilysin family protein [Vicinamibacterales bacterium]